MKKKGSLWTVILAFSLTAMLLSGCGAEEQISKTTTNNAEDEAEPAAASTPEPAAAVTPTDAGAFEYEELNDGTIIITGLKDTTLETMVIPQQIDGKQVTSIRMDAFRDCSNLISVTIPDSVTSIGDKAFINCGSLTSVIIPDSVTSIGGGAFGKCRSLTSVTIPDSVTRILPKTFQDCSSLTVVTIPDSVTFIAPAAFSDCSSLTTITAPAGSYAEEWAKENGYSVQN